MSAVTVEEVVNYVLKTPFNTNRAILTSMLEELEGSADDGVVQLRRDNDYNYAAVGNTFIPAIGEVCLVDTARDGLRAKCGDGVTVWNNLEYIDEYVVKGYLYNGKFYKDSAHTKPISGAIHKIYIDIPTRSISFFEGENFLSTSGAQKQASETEAGVMKLYQSVGTNSDGTMSQKAIADELDDKIEITLNASEELLVFTN